MENMFDGNAGVARNLPGSCRGISVGCLSASVGSVTGALSRGGVTCSVEYCVQCHSSDAQCTRGVLCFPRRAQDE